MTGKDHVSDNQTIDYRLLIDQSLLGVIKKILKIVEKDQKTPRPHFFYIDFLTSHPDTKVPDILRQKYPDVMTIILQYQFKDLKVHTDSFSVTLSFSGKDIEITVPFKAITHFADPSVGFELEFDEKVRASLELGDKLTDEMMEEYEEEEKSEGPKLIKLDFSKSNK